jgi:hypothetical protein
MNETDVTSIENQCSTMKILVCNNHQEENSSLLPSISLIPMTIKSYLPMNSVAHMKWYIKNN